jgi:hypothetical protein
MTKRTVALLVLGACGGGGAATAVPAANGPPTSVTASTSPSVLSSTPVTTSAPVPASAPTGGSLLIGEIVSPKAFDPRPVLVSLEPRFLGCYNQARASVPSLHGKLKLRIHVNEGGAFAGVEAEEGGSANDATLVACLGDAMRSARFPKPGGSATIVAPLVFRP